SPSRGGRRQHKALGSFVSLPTRVALARSRARGLWGGIKGGGESQAQGGESSPKQTLPARGGRREGPSIEVEYLFRRGPPFPFGARRQRRLHRHADGPPFLRARIGGHGGHVGVVVVAGIFVIGKQQVFRLAQE